MYKNRRIPLNIQLFAENELDDLVKELSGEETKPTETQTESTKVEPTKVEPEKVETKPTETEQTKVGEKLTETEEVTEDDDDDEPEVGEDGKPKKKSIKELRETYKAEKKRAKELEEQRLNLEKETKTVKEKLLKAIKLGIKGETEEEILENLAAHEVKEEAAKSGLTEEQVRKEAQLKKDIENLTKEKQEVLFNKRAFMLQRELSIDDKQLLKFINKAAGIGIDLLKTPTEFKEIYNTIMGTPDVQLSEKEKEIMALRAEVARLKGEKAPGAGVEGTDARIDPSDWEAVIANMKGK